MKKFRSKRLLCCVCMGALSGAAFADDGGFNSNLNLNLPEFGQQQYESTPLLYALNDNDKATSDSDKATSFSKDNKDFKEPWLTGSKVHEYLGLGALALVGLTALAPKEEGGAHEHFAKAATVLASAAVTTGLIYHWDDFHLKDGFKDPDNQHVMLGALGALAMLYAVSKAPDSGHAGAGLLGGAAMGVAIKITW